MLSQSRNERSGLCSIAGAAYTAATRAAITAVTRVVFMAYSSVGIDGSSETTELMTDYPHWTADVAVRYRDAGYWRGQLLASLIADHARTDGGRIAIVDHQRDWTYSDLDRVADRWPRASDASARRRQSRRHAAPKRQRLRGSVRQAVQTRCRADVRVADSPQKRDRYLRSRRSGRLHHRRHAVRVRLLRPARDVPPRGEDRSTHHHRWRREEFPTLLDIEAEPEPLSPPHPSDVAFLLLSGGTTDAELIPRRRLCLPTQGDGSGTAFDRDGVISRRCRLRTTRRLVVPALGALSLRATVPLLSPSPDKAFAAVEREGVTLTTLMPPLIQLWRSGGVQRCRLSGVLAGGIGEARGGAGSVQNEWGLRLSQWFRMAEGF